MSPEKAKNIKKFPKTYLQNGFFKVSYILYSHQIEGGRYGRKKATL